MQRDTAICESVFDHAARRTVARRGMDVPRVGCAARRVYRGRASVAEFPHGARVALGDGQWPVALELPRRVRGGDIHRGALRVGVLPREDALLLDGAPEGEPGADRELHGLGVQRREDAREPEADRTGVGVRSVAERGAAGAEHLGVRFDLAVDFEADGDEVGHGKILRVDG